MNIALYPEHISDPFLAPSPSEICSTIEALFQIPNTPLDIASLKKYLHRYPKFSPEYFSILFSYLVSHRDAPILTKRVYDEIILHLHRRSTLRPRTENHLWNAMIQNTTSLYESITHQSPLHQRLIGTLRSSPENIRL